MSNQIRKIKTPANEESCPADALMCDFRRKLQEKSISDYAKHTDISQSSIKYWMDHADLVIEENDSIIFSWDEILDKNLPPLKIKVKKGVKGYSLIYLKEYGEDHLLIQGKNRKGKNKNGINYLDKETKKGRGL